MTASLSPMLTLEPLRWWDLPTVAELERRLFPGDSPWPEATFWSELAAGHYYLACWDDAELVGYAGLSRGPDSADGAELHTIGVRRDHQGRGIGRRLLTAMLAYAGDRSVRLEVRTDNDPAIALYRGFGFQQVGLRRRYYQPSGADAFTMVRPA